MLPVGSTDLEMCFFPIKAPLLRLYKERRSPLLSSQPHYVQENKMKKMKKKKIAGLGMASPCHLI